jgi:hypothetical protein
MIHTSEGKTYAHSRSAYEGQHHRNADVGESNPSSDKSGVNSITNGTISATPWKVSARNYGLQYDTYKHQKSSHMQVLTQPHWQRHLELSWILQWRRMRQWLRS